MDKQISNKLFPKLKLFDSRNNKPQLNFKKRGSILMPSIKLLMEKNSEEKKSHSGSRNATPTLSLSTKNSSPSITNFNSYNKNILNESFNADVYNYEIKINKTREFIPELDDKWFKRPYKRMNLKLHPVRLNKLKLSKKKRAKLEAEKKKTMKNVEYLVLPEAENYELLKQNTFKILEAK